MLYVIVSKFSACQDNFLSSWVKPVLSSGYTVNSEIFVSALFLRNFAFRENKTPAKWQITLSFVDICKPCLGREFFTSLICLLMLFAKIKFSRKIPNLHKCLAQGHNTVPLVSLDLVNL